MKFLRAILAALASRGEVADVPDELTPDLRDRIDGYNGHDVWCGRPGSSCCTNEGRRTPKVRPPVDPVDAHAADNPSYVDDDSYRRWAEADDLALWADEMPRSARRLARLLMERAQ